jgi:hypothetical protein
VIFFTEIEQRRDKDNYYLKVTLGLDDCMVNKPEEFLNLCLDNSVIPVFPPKLFER